MNEIDRADAVASDEASRFKREDLNSGTGPDDDLRGMAGTIDPAAGAAGDTSVEAEEYPVKEVSES